MLHTLSPHTPQRAAPHLPRRAEARQEEGVVGAGALVPVLQEPLVDGAAVVEDGPPYHEAAPRVLVAPLGLEVGQQAGVEAWHGARTKGGILASQAILPAHACRCIQQLVRHAFQGTFWARSHWHRVH